MKLISSKNIKAISLMLLACLIAGTYGCGGAASTGSTSTPPPVQNPGQTAKITITSSARITNIGNAISLSARAVDAGGTGVPGVTIVFTSSGIGTLNANFQITDANGYADATLYSSAVGNTTVKAFTNTMSASLDLYFVDGEIKNKIKVSVDRNGNNVYDETGDFTVSGTSGEQVKIRATYTDAGGYPLANKTITMSSSSNQVSFAGKTLTTDGSGNVYTFATFTNKLNTIYVDIIATADDGTVGTATLKLQSFIIGDILLYADNYVITTADKSKLTACLIDDGNFPIKLADLKVNFEAAPADIGVFLPFTFTDDTGCATNDFKPQKEGKITVTASFTSVKATLDITVNKVQMPLKVIPQAPSVTKGTSTLTMVIGGTAPYTVTSLNPSLTDPDSWTVAKDGDAFQVTGVNTGTATLVVKDSANNLIEVPLTIN